MRREKKKPGPKEGVRHHAYSDDRRRNQLLAAGGAAGGGALTAGYVTAAKEKQKIKLATEQRLAAGRLAKSHKEIYDIINKQAHHPDGKTGADRVREKGIDPKERPSETKYKARVEKKIVDSDMGVRPVRGNKNVKWESKSGFKRFLQGIPGLGGARVPWDMVKKWR